MNQAAYDYGTIFVGVSEGVSQRIEDSPASVIKALGRWDALDSSLGYVNFRAVLEMQGGAGNEQIYGEFFGTGDIIGVCLDMDRRELSFFIDGMKFGQHIVKDLGRAFQFKAKQVLYPCVGLRKSRGDSVTIGKWTHVRNPSPLMSLRSLGASLLQLEHFYGSGVGIASHIADACWDHYTQWSQRAEGLRGRFHWYPSRCGGRYVKLDTSPEACKAACALSDDPGVDFRFGDVVKIAQSCGRALEKEEEAIILGCARTSCGTTSLLNITRTWRRALLTHGISIQPSFRCWPF